MEEIERLTSDLFYSKEMLFFFGIGSSLSGKKNDGPFPSYSDFKNMIVKDVTGKDFVHELKILDELVNEEVDEKQKESLLAKIKDSKKNRDSEFKKIIAEWTEQTSLSHRISKYLEGEPGMAHYLLASIATCLLTNKTEYRANILLSFTTNYDNLIENAYSRILQNKNIARVSLDAESSPDYLKQISRNIDDHLKNGTPVVVKLFGDLNYVTPIFEQTDMTVLGKYQHYIKKWIEWPIVFVGFSFSDAAVNWLIEKSGSNQPIYIVNPGIEASKLPQKRNAIIIRKRFDEFAVDLLNAIDKRVTGFKKLVREEIGKLNPVERFHDYSSIVELAKDVSAYAQKKGEAKLLTDKVHGVGIVPIDRVNSRPDIARFLLGTRPLMALIGESGTGKSTMLYQIARLNNVTNECNFAAFFIEAKTIPPTGELESFLASQFYCQRHQIRDVLVRFQQILAKEDRYAIILLDGINESPYRPKQLKNEIEALGLFIAKHAPRIKILYSCREIYWRSYIYTSSSWIPELYFDSQEFILGKYDSAEAKFAFDSYQRAFNFAGNFDNLKSEFKEKIRDPLMLRMLAEAYRGEKLPEFAPAVLIFEKYERTIKEEKGEIYIDFCAALAQYKYDEAATIDNANDLFDKDKIISSELFSRFRSISSLAENQDPVKACLTHLEDEGIIGSIDEETRFYRFTYDRFFEYLIGKHIGRHLNLNDPSIDVTEVLISEVELLSKKNFFLLQGLKAEVIRLMLTRKNDFFQRVKWALLLKSPLDRVKHFAKDLIKEMSIEAKLDVPELLKSEIHDKDEWIQTCLDVSTNTEEIISLVLGGLFSGNVNLIRRCGAIAKHKIASFEIEESDLAAKIRDQVADPTQNQIKGLLYLLGYLFSIPAKNTAGFDAIIYRITVWLGPDLLSKPDFTSLLVSTFCEVVKYEGPTFFSSSAQLPGMDYRWKVMGDIEKAKSEQLYALIGADIEAVEQNMEIFLFFGSEKKYWNDRNLADAELYIYWFEHRIAEWILIDQGIRSTQRCFNLLNEFVNTGFWLNIDFALCIMQYIIKYTDNEETRSKGYQQMEEWTFRFEQNYPIEFYRSLTGEDPFHDTYNPLAQVAYVASKLFPSQTTNHFVSKYFEDGLRNRNSDKIALGLLALRQIWQSCPEQTIQTFRIIMNVDDVRIQTWGKLLLREIYMIHPQLIEDFLWKTKASGDFLIAARYMKEVQDTLGVEHSISPFMSYFFISGDTRMKKILKHWLLYISEVKNIDGYAAGIGTSVLTAIRNRLPH